MILQCGNPSGRLPRYARNDTVLRTEHNKILFAEKYSQTLRTLFMLSRATHLMSLRGATRRGNLPEGTPYYKTHARYFIMGPNGILCTRWEKEYASVRQTVVACDDCLVKNEAYDAEKKAHTSKRVSIIACNDVISKAQCAPRYLNICF